MAKTIIPTTHNNISNFIRIAARNQPTPLDRAMYERKIAIQKIEEVKNLKIKESNDDVNPIATSFDEKV